MPANCGAGSRRTDLRSARADLQASQADTAVHRAVRGRARSALRNPDINRLREIVAFAGVPRNGQDKSLAGTEPFGLNRRGERRRGFSSVGIGKLGREVVQCRFGGDLKLLAVRGPVYLQFIGKNRQVVDVSINAVETVASSGRQVGRETGLFRRYPEAKAIVEMVCALLALKIRKASAKIRITSIVARHPAVTPRARPIPPGQQCRW